MAETLTLDRIAKALADALTAACGARLGGDATAAPSELPDSAGLTLAVPVSAPVTGRITVWFEATSAEACARVALALEAAPDRAAVDRFLIELANEATRALSAQPDLAGVTFGAPSITPGRAPAGARAIYVAVPNTASCLFAVGVERPAAPAPVIDERMGAVLDVDLPLVVRFGRTVMPLRSIAELGPGSVIDMGRSPEEPVELLVGERLIARGEVVVIGGNYGVRITHLAGREPIGARESRMS